jgi:uncharacterized protein (DUF924 family)
MNKFPPKVKALKMAGLLRSKAGEILSFWFAHGTAEQGTMRGAWFKKDPAFDEEIRSKFLPVVEAIEASVLGSEDTANAVEEQLPSPDTDSPQTMLAYIIACDQFPRNLFRDSGRAFGLDFVAREAACLLIEAKKDLELSPVERLFVYLPFEHSENLEDQHESARLFAELGALDPKLAMLPKFAQSHLDIIARFGRFPHRNHALGRESTPEEVAFLQTPGSSF